VDSLIATYDAFVILPETEKKNISIYSPLEAHQLCSKCLHAVQLSNTEGNNLSHSCGSKILHYKPEIGKGKGKPKCQKLFNALQQHP
jgi:hypothetical protein